MSYLQYGTQQGGHSLYVTLLEAALHSTDRGGVYTTILDTTAEVNRTLQLRLQTYGMSVTKCCPVHLVCPRSPRGVGGGGMEYKQK